MIHTDENDWQYYESLDEAKQDGYTPIPVTNLVQFFTLRGRTTTICKANLVPVECQYLILAKTAEYTRYYLRNYRGYSVDQLYFYRRDIDFSGEDESIDTLRTHAYDDRLWLLYTEEQVTETKKMLERVVKANVEGEAHLSYKTFIEIVEREVRLEDYKNCYRNQMGFKTVCHSQEEVIRGLWKSTMKK